MTLRWQVRCACGDLFWSIASFAVLLVVAAVAVDRWLPEVRDGSYTLRERHLLERLKATPSAPLVLVLGSSRTETGLRAESLGKNLTDTETVVFNFGFASAGPMVELVCLRRLLARGIRPDLLFIEVIPAQCHLAGGRPMEEVMLYRNRLSAAEVRFLMHYHSQPRRLAARWCLDRLSPMMYRAELHEALLLDRSRLPAADAALDWGGWAPTIREVSPEQRQLYTAVARDQYDEACADARLAGGTQRALHDLLSVCKRERIPAALLLMPEGSTFRALYSASAEAGLKKLLQELAAEYEVSVVDARLWVDDTGFWDGHHLLPPGAAVFTERFGREALAPMLRQMRRGYW
jgi:hypothetical protein